MPRVDVWDIPEDKPREPIWIGYRQGLTDKYDLGKKLGEGGFGSVRIVVLKSNGAEFACKSICKRLDVPNLPPIKQQQHLENIKREVLILRKLRGTLNVVHLACVYEDESHVHIIMEYCRGGELFHKMGRRHYSERTVASYMRAVLRTLAQCHAQRILHRDIKPGNFMLLSEAEDSPLKAIDFGLAVLFDPSKLPRTDLGLEGTPWYMAPEVLSSCVEPASDVWAAGVMAYQLLSGRFPFDDWAHPQAPALSLVWRSILSESPSFKGSSWGEVSDAAKDFCKKLLDKDVLLRPSAREALSHPWLQQGNTQQRLQGTQLTQVVQRLQRHSQQNVFKKTVLDMMANELLARHMARAQQQQVLSPPVSGSPAAAAAAVSSPGGVRVLPSLPGLPGVACVTPQYAEGSVNRRQQLLRLVPPAKRSSSLDLGSSGGAHDRAAAAAAAGSGIPAAAAAAGQGVQSSAPLWPGAGMAGRLEGTWHGPGLGGAAGGSDSSPGGLDGSVRGRRGLGSLRGATSALEALRRARERAAAATVGNDVNALAGGGGGGVTAYGRVAAAAAAAAGGGVAVLPAPPAEDGAATGAAGEGGDGSVRYKGPVKDPGTASLWDLQFMAGRLAMEGSAHGNAYTQRLLQAASTHAGKTPAAATMLQAAATLASQQQQQQQEQQQQQQQQPGASPQAQILTQQQQAVGSPQMASAAAAHRLEGTWHGPSRSASINVATVARQSTAQSAHRPDIDRDLSWHGRTSHMRHLNEQEIQSGSKRANEHEEFLQFLEAAKRQRQEQRKVARLVLEGSTHGGVQYFLPARGTSSIAVAMGADAGPMTAGPAILAEGDDSSSDDDDNESSIGVASKSSRSSRPSTPGSSGHGSTAAAAAGSVDPPPPGRPGILVKLKHSLKQILTPAEPTRNTSRNSSSSDLNALARSSWRPGLATQDPVLGVLGAPQTAQGASGASLQDHSPIGTPKGRGTAATPSTAAAAAAAAAAAPPGVSNSSGSSSGVPSGPHVQLAEQILELQSPGWQASLESRRRGQGAYAALMAATSMATEAAGAASGPPSPPAAALDAGAQSAPPASGRAAAGESAAAPAAAAAAGAEQGGGARRKLPLGAVPALEAGLTPLEQALQVQTQQQTKQQQDANTTMLLRPGSISQQQQQESAVEATAMQQGLLPLPGNKQQAHPPPPAAASWQPPGADSMLPLPRSTHQPQQRQQQRARAELLPTPGTAAAQQQQVHAGGDLLPMPSTSAAQQQQLVQQQRQTQQQHVTTGLLPMPGTSAAQQHAGAGLLLMPGTSAAQQQVAAAVASRPAAAAAAVHGSSSSNIVLVAPVRPPAAAADEPQGGDPSILPMPVGNGSGSGSGTGPGRPQPPAAAAAAAAAGCSPFADGVAGMDASAPKGSAGAAATQPDTLTTPAAAPPATAASSNPRPLGLPPSGGSGSLVPALADVSRLLDLLAGTSPELVTVEQLQAGLAGLGYLLEPSEVLELACSLGYGVEGAQGVPLSQLAASQLDWEELQVNHREEWLQCLRTTFDAMDADRDGRLRPSEILEALKDKLPEAEVNAAIEDVLLEAAADEDEGLDFAAFKMLASLAAGGSLPLDQYDSRLAAAGSQEEEASGHGQGVAVQLLHTVPEAEQ